MIELFGQNIRTNRRQSSKGNQLKWENDGIWYKADYTGYEGLADYTACREKGLLVLEGLADYNFREVVS